jgi:hypothetical protein
MQTIKMNDLWRWLLERPSTSYFTAHGYALSLHYTHDFVVLAHPALVPTTASHAVAMIEFLLQDGYLPSTYVLVETRQRYSQNSHFYAPLHFETNGIVCSEPYDFPDEALAAIRRIDSCTQ